MIETFRSTHIKHRYKHGAMTDAYKNKEKIVGFKTEILA